MKFCGDGPFEVCFERNWDLHTGCAFLWERLRGQRIRAPFVNTRAQMMHQLQLRAWAVPRNKLLKDFYQKQVSIKRFLKRNVAQVGIAQCMNALAAKVQKKEVPCTQ